MQELVFILVSSLIALAFAAYLALKISSKDPGNKKMVEIANAIQEGAEAFLKREYQVLALVVVIITVTLALGVDVAGTDINEGIYTAIAFLVGAFRSFSF